MCQPGSNKLSQYKILVTFNGVPVTPDTLFCQVYEKDKVSPGKDTQGSYEQTRTSVRDMSDSFVCKPRFAKPGVGVLDLYYIGPQTKEFIGDYGIVLTASLRIGRTTVVGTDLQDVCLLGWSMANRGLEVTLPDARGVYNTWENPLGPFVSCENAALWQRSDQGVPIPSTTSG